MAHAGHAFAGYVYRAKRPLGLQVESQASPTWVAVQEWRVMLQRSGKKAVTGTQEVGREGEGLWMKSRRCAGACHAGAHAPVLVVWCSPYSFLREASGGCEAQVAAAQGKRTPGWRAASGAKCVVHECPCPVPGGRCCSYC